MKPTTRKTTYLCILTTLLFWGSSFAVIRYGLASPANPGGFHPGALALFRFGTAAVVALGYLIITRQGLPRARDLWRIALAGLLGISVYHFCLNFGEQVVPAGAASIIIAFAPIFVALISARFLKERLGGWGWLGVVCSFAGVCLVGFTGAAGFRINIHALAVMGSALATAIYFVLSKELLKRYSGIQLTSYAIIAGALFLLIFAPQLIGDARHASTGATMAALYIGVFPGFIAYALWGVALSRLPATQVTVFLNAEPLFAAAIAWIWLGEVPSHLVAIGAILAIAGVLMVQLMDNKSHAETSAEEPAKPATEPARHTPQ
ncbi:MAG: DMT family transporter [Coriobacteriia bacterium]|nr:DMT family transporter [Coriobacteriia bacterium]